MTTPVKKRILMVTHYYPPHHGGIEIVASTQAAKLAAKGYQVTVVTSKVSEQEHDLRSGNLQVIRVRAWNGFEKSGASFPVFSPRLWSVLYKQVKQADVVHVHDSFYMGSFVAAICARWQKKPLVMTQHVAMIAHDSPAVMTAQRLVYATTGKFIFNSCRTILTLNDRVADFLLERGVKKEKLQNSVNGIDTERFAPATAAGKKAAREELGIAGDTKVVLFLGRLAPKKGFDKVLAAANKEYVLVFGGGPVTAAMRATPHTKFLGPIAPDKTHHIYHAADVYVLPSVDEGFPLTIQEAMACGLPIITTNDPGYARYQLDHKFVQLIEPTNEAVQQAIREVFALSPKDRAARGAYSRRYAKAHFTWDKVVAVLEAVYAEATA